MQNKIKEMDFLKALGIDANNQGTSTGSNWIRSSGEKIDSFSPVDGKLIGSVSAADKASYEKIIQTAESAFKQWRLMTSASKRRNCETGW